MVEGEELEAIARRGIDSNQFITIGTADEEGVPWVSPAWYAPAEYREFFWVSDPEVLQESHRGLSCLIFDLLPNPRASTIS
jgi:hypothetical protein